jgi:hypothetical protein
LVGEGDPEPEVKLGPGQVDEYMGMVFSEVLNGEADDVGEDGMPSSAAAAAYHPMTFSAAMAMMEMRYSSCVQSQSSRLVSESMICLFSEMTDSMVRLPDPDEAALSVPPQLLDMVQPDGAWGNNRTRMSMTTVKQLFGGWWDWAQSKAEAPLV